MENRTESVYREIPAATLHLERVEAAAMGKLAQLITDDRLDDAWSVCRMMRYLSLV